MILRIAATLLFCFTALAATAQDPSPDLGQDIPPDEWRALALGQTLVYVIGGDLFAYERYAISGNQVELQLSNGDCLFGTWTHSQNAYCFDWGDETPACFRHVRRGEDIFIIEQHLGQDTGGIQQMVGTTEAPLLCGQNMS